MGKNKKHRPFVSICTPTFNRRPFIENMFQCFRNQDYPKDRMEWIIVDDGTDKINDLIAKANIPQIKYFAVDTKMTLGAKRNLMHKHTKGSIIVYMDDDDYYPPDRVSHAVEKLESNKQALCAGSSEIYIYFKTLNRMVQCGPYGPNHATAGTFAFRRELLDQTKYEDHAALAEERAFLKDYTIPFVQLDPMKSILVFSHEHNTFDKRKMLENPHPDYLKDSTKTVNDFIKNKNEESIKDFFMNKIDKLLEAYEPGSPKMKPDVLEQIKKIEAERAEMLKKAQNQTANQIILQKPGEEPVVITPHEAVNIMQQQQGYIGELSKEKEVNTKRIAELEKMIIQLQMQIISKNKELKELKSTTSVVSPTETKPNNNNEEVITTNVLSAAEIPKSVPLMMVEAD
uniref:Glycosyltransferase 2-like domain-containing protein n=1 Tax=viral metagenome TaxID=1070528 RepID=A0A6C0HBY1_9ZZZZ